MGIETEQRLALLEKRLAALEAAVKARWVEPLAAPIDAAPDAAKPQGKGKATKKRGKA